MNLYEFTTGRIGASYERAYIWAENTTQAFMVLMETNKTLYMPDWKIRLLFSADDKPFCTNLSTDGWEV